MDSRISSPRHLLRLQDWILFLVSVTRCITHSASLRLFFSSRWFPEQVKGLPVLAYVGNYGALLRLSFSCVLIRMSADRNTFKVAVQTYTCSEVAACFYRVNNLYPCCACCADRLSAANASAGALIRGMQGHPCSTDASYVIVDVHICSSCCALCLRLSASQAPV